MIEVLRASPLLTVQDTGRSGLRHLGVPLTGMMDTPALMAANLLLGNPIDAAGLEVSFGPTWLKAHQDIQIVLMGTDMRARLMTPDGKHSIQDYLAPGFIHDIPAGHRIHCQAAADPGQRSCLAVAGGIDVPLVMGSRSTDLNNAFGGYQGRTLRAGDILPVAISSRQSNKGAKSHGIRQARANMTLRTVTGPEYGAFTDRSQSAFWHTEWQVTPLSNRMGLRLNGERLRLQQPGDRQSSGVMPGVIQIPPDGQPIILGNDGQTTGGYPQLGSVVAADLWQLAYLSPGTVINFLQISIDDALALSATQSLKLKQLELWLGWSQS
ncbi:biotin-dependent carboxyltransferase family protein [Pseudohongiella sp.]|uniref:Carboxyltransferase domain-containing protein n=1 Tax=marine sediment metagenome TaxID=412755 RepID=A0A0F9YL68_9ZZZZ|nr:biotin-dependent carboxyltransferase family protein [Pseudohongiella sp.]HDZ10500.1 biotin-dependent carboxyltransferase family protein [Pseudohongiella sp.]HEA63865.1 biotin-dependent carboxyltransferase family protein [Pseudohongiella sp.]